jgi:hypothetical protein
MPYMFRKLKDAILWLACRQVLKISGSNFGPGTEYSVCACVCMARRRVHAALLTQHATRMRHTMTSFVAPLTTPLFSKLFHKGHDF